MNRPITILLLLSMAIGTFAQAPKKQSQNTKSAENKGTAMPKAAVSSQPIDKEYTDSILKNTTEKFFLTEMVDHLPASATVPSPAKILGYPIGTPEKLTYTKDQYRYYRELEKSTPRVKTFIAPEKSEQGRDQMLIVVSDEANVANLARVKDITSRLSDPRKLNDELAAQLVKEGKAIYWLSGSIHSTETGSPEMLMELAYRLAVEDSPMIQAIRKNVIVMITPTLEVDGRDIMVDLYNYRKANPGKRSPGLIYWGKYVAHDNNRDSMGMALALSRNQMHTFLDYHPTVLHDLHESVPYLYTSTGTGPYNAWLDPIVIDEWQMLAYHEIEGMTKRGVPGVWTHGFYDGWAANYMFYVANGHNSIGRFYETYGNGGADTQDRTVGGETARTWFRPNPPLPRVKWSLRNNVNMQQSALLLAMSYVADNKDKFLNNFYLKSKRSVAKARTEGPAAYVFPGDDPRANAASGLVNILKMQGCEVHRLTKETELKEGKFPVGSYVVRMDQPYSRMADMLLDTQYYNVSDPRPYDDTGWTFGPLHNVKTVRVKDEKVLDAPMVIINGPSTVTGKIEGTGKNYVINHTGESEVAQLRFRLKDIKMSAAEDSFKLGDKTFRAGSVIIRSEGNPADVQTRLAAEVTRLGLTAAATDKLPDVGQHSLGVPRVALVHTWINTQNEGWYRIEFDRLGIPYDYISDQQLARTPNLRDKWDVIIFGPVGGNAQAIVRGNPRRGENEAPIPWKKSDLTPNMGLSPDQTDDIRGGMGLQGVLNLQRFIESGGLFVTVGGNASIPIEFGITEGVSIQESSTLQARGSVYNAVFADRRSPISYGYDERLAVYFNQAPLLNVTGAGGGGFGGGGGGGAGAAGQTGANRPTGRGSIDDPDVVQGRAPLPVVQTTPNPEQAALLALNQPPLEMRPRVVLRFAPEKELLISGMLAGGADLAGKAAVVDIPVGKGHVVMFANNPMWRHETQGSFTLLFNAILNFDNLGAGRQAARPPGAAARPGEEMEQ